VHYVSTTHFDVTMMRRLLFKGARRPYCNANRTASTVSKNRTLPKDGLSLTDFIQEKLNDGVDTASTLLPFNPDTTSFHIKTYGCQMNVSDSDIVRALLLKAGFRETLSEADAIVLLTNTCAIRENAERKVWNRLKEQRAHYKSSKKQQKKDCGSSGMYGGTIKGTSVDGWTS